MRYLKNKILRAQQAQKPQPLDASSLSDELCVKEEESPFLKDSTHLSSMCYRGYHCFQTKRKKFAVFHIKYHI